MTSKTFRLGDEKKSVCVKALLGIIAVGVLTTGIIIGYYVFRSASVGGGFFGCGAPELDPNGLSNWTVGATVIAFGCFGDHSLQGDKISVSNCVDNVWTPEPPICIALPLHLICTVENKGLKGTVHMWQYRKEDQLQIYGILSAGAIDKTQSVYSEDIVLSRTTCFSSDDYNFTVPENSANDTDSGEFIEIKYSTDSLVAYKKAELRIVIAFIDSEKMAILATITQEHVTKVIPNTNNPAIDWTLNGDHGRPTNNKTQTGPDAATPA